MKAGEQTLSRSYHTLLRLVRIGCSLSSDEEEHHASRDQQAENDEQDDERPIRSRLDGEARLRVLSNAGSPHRPAGPAIPVSCL